MKKPLIDLFKKETGMTLIEILLSVGIFAFMFVFIAQITKQNYRQVKKVMEDSRSVHSVSHILDIMRQDFRGVSYLLDINHNLYAQFPIEEEEETLEDKNKESFNQKGKYRQTPLFFSSEYLFEGSENKMEFSSYSFIEKFEQETPLVQWVRLRYSIETCKTKELSGSCLIRSVRRYWDSNKQEEGKELVLLRGFQSLKFSYADAEALLEGEWQNEWEPEKVSDAEAVFTDQVLELPFPSAVQVEGKKGERQQNFFFPLASSYLKVWNPMAKDFPGFPEWKIPKRDKADKKESENKPATQYRQQRIFNRN